MSHWPHLVSLNIEKEVHPGDTTLLGSVKGNIKGCVLGKRQENKLHFDQRKKDRQFLQAKITLSYSALLALLDKKWYAQTRKDKADWASHDQQDLPAWAGIYSLRCKRAQEWELHGVQGMQCLLHPDRLFCWHIWLIRGKVELHRRNGLERSRLANTHHLPKQWHH